MMGDFNVVYFVVVVIIIVIVVYCIVCMMFVFVKLSEVGSLLLCVSLMCE